MHLLALAVALLAPQDPAGDAQAQVLPPQVLDAAAELGISLPETVPSNWRQLHAAAPEPQSPPAAQTAPWPTDGWTRSTPWDQGMDWRLIRDAFVYAQGQGSNALFVARHGYLVAEWYDSDWAPPDREDGFSMAKSVTSALYGAALQDGIFASPTQTASTWIADWRDPAHQNVEIRHLLSMNSGLHWDWFTDYVLLGLAWDQSDFAVSLGMDAAPGDVWVYNNSAVQVLSALFEERTGRQVHEYFQARMAGIIGMDHATWMTDLAGNTTTYRSVHASAGEFAKFGYLFLRDGVWEGAQILPRQWVRRSAQPSQGLNPFYGLLWWLNTAGLDMPDVPADAYYAAGLGEKRIYVVPSLDLVVVRLGPPALFWEDNAYLGPICESVW